MIGRKWKIGALALLTTMAMAGALSGSLAWFNDFAVLPEERIEGSIRGAYFAYGDGSKDNPYGITIPRHLYNLAWLQYSGFFNKVKKDADGNNVIDKTFYFELSDEIENGVLDMTGYTLPPIGTEEYPFIGEFNGNGNIVTNLDVSNSFDAFGTNHPTTITSASFAAKQPQIVGFFGVVGALPNPTYAYDSSANRIFDTGLTNINVSTVTSSSLIGVVAGYVNGDISGVAIDGSQISLDSGTSTALTDYTLNISDYGVVGFVAKSSRKKTITRVDETIYDLNISDVKEFNANDQGDTQGFGGSIDMKSLYDNICDNVWEVVTGNTLDHDNDTHVAQYPTRATQSIDENGNVDGPNFDMVNNLSSSSGTSALTMSGTEEGYFTSGDETDRRYYNYDIKDGGDTTSSFGMIIETGASSIDREKRYMCLSGERRLPVSNAATLTTTYYDSNTGSFITYVAANGTRNYLNYNGNQTPQNVTATSDASCNASLWTLSNNSLSTINLASTSYPNTQKYYLNCSAAGTLTITTTNSTTWNHDAHGYYATVNGTKHYLGFKGTAWTTTTYSEAYNEVFYTISDGGTNYMGHAESITSSANVTSIPFNGADADIPATIKWQLSGNYVFAYGSNGTTQYFVQRNDSNVRYRNQNSNRFSLSSTSSGSVTLSYNTGGWFSSTTYYVYHNGTTWVNSERNRTVTLSRKEIRHAAGYDTEIGAENVILSDSTVRYSDQKSRTSTIDSYAPVSPTYIPLTWKKNANKEPIFGVPDEYNTGYIVSGAKYLGDPYGDIRVSRFELPASLSGSGFTQSTGAIGTYYTINDSGTQVQIDQSTASDTFKASSSYLQDKVLSGQSYVYGLHFMNAQISFGPIANSSVQKYRDNYVGQSAYAEKAVINKETYTNYELPTDCIDFNLKEKGYINFIAGTYYQKSSWDASTRNNSFFSLYEVVRNNDQSIKELRQISEVLADSNVPNSYQYLYDKAYADPSNPSVTGRYSVPFKIVTINNEATKVQLNGNPYTEHSVQSSAYSGYSSQFKTSWIGGRNYTQILYQAAYYFEIPMNQGEYCLGSVSGYNGAYLMYLDIGANAAKVYRTVMSERFRVTELEMEYPLGVAIFSSPSSITSSMKTNHEEHLHLACAKLSTGFAGGTLSFAVDANDSDLVKITGYVANNAVPIFQGDNIKLNIADKLVPKSTVTKDIKRVEYYDYSVNTQETTHVVITFTSTNGGGYERDIKCYDAKGNEITDSSKWKIYRTKTGKKYALSEIVYANLTSTGDDGLFYTERGTADANILVTIRYWETSSVTGETAYQLNLTASTDANGKNTFVFKDYTLEVTATGGSLTVEVLKKGSKTIKIGNTTVTAVGQTIAINP